VHVDSLQPWDRNPVIHDDEQVADLEALIAATVWTAPIVARTSDHRVIAGHGRRLAALRAIAADAAWRLADAPAPGMVPVRLVDVDDATATRLTLADNALTKAAPWDDSELADLLRALGDDAVGIGFDADDLAALLDEPVERPAATDDVPEVQVEVHSRPGEVYELGPHRLVCGDSTNEAHVALAGLMPDLLLTDPPYCSGGFQEAGRSVGSIGSEQVKKGGKYDGGIANDRLSTRGYQALMRRVLEVWGGTSAYVFTDWRMWLSLYDVLEAAGFGVRSMIVWDKGIPGMGRGWRTQHELVAFAIRAPVEFDNHKTNGNVIRANRTGNKLHPTQKPVEILETVLRVSDWAKVIGDPFAGSGSTLMACATSDRVFVGCEMSPVFCDVIRRRWTRYAREAGIDAGSGALDG
jgi:DNA modification methylase